MKSPIIRQALMRHYNEYFTLSPEERDKFHLDVPESIDDKIRDFIRDKLLIIKDTEVEQEVNRLNEQLLYMYGLGENPFQLNEFDWNHEILNDKNLYEYVKRYHDWQEEAFVSDENFPKYEKKEKLYVRFNHWARTIVDDKFYYLSLMGIPTYMCYEIEDRVYDWIEQQIPHEYYDGEDHGKADESGNAFTWDVRIDAKGKEGWLDRIKKEFYEMQHEYTNKYHSLTEFENDIFVLDKSKENDPYLDYIFGGLPVLNHVTFHNFVGDCKPHVVDPEKLYRFRDNEIDLFINELSLKLDHIKATFAPNDVPKNPNEMKVMIHEDALDDLNDL